MGGGSSVAGKAYRDLTPDEVASDIDGLGEGFAAFAAHVRKEGHDGETILDVDFTLDDLLDGVDEAECKKPRIKKLQKNLDKLRASAGEDGQDWDTLAHAGKWEEANALAEKQNEASEIFPCSKKGCKAYHGNYQVDCEWRGFCTPACKENWEDDASTSAYTFLGRATMGGGIDLQTQDADWWATSGREHLSRKEVKDPLVKELKARDANMRAAYAEMAEEIEDELHQVRSISSEMNGESCKTDDVENPTQPNVRDKNPEIDLYTYARKNAPKLAPLVDELVDSVEGKESPMKKYVAWNLKLPASFYRKAEQMKKW
eukprot:g770.t1